MKKETLIIALLCGFFSTAAAQNTLKGRVVDSKGNSVVGAKVENSKNSAENTTTDMNGQFYLTTREPADKVTVRYIGMATRRKKAKQDMTIRMSQLSSQVTWNIKAGAGANFGGDYATFTDKVGVGPEIHLFDHWSVMPSLEAAYKSFKCEDNYGYTETTSIIYTQIPILAAYRFRISNSMNMKLKAGPYFALNLYDNHNDDSHFTDAPSIKKVDLGLDAGVDFEIKHFVFGIESEIGLINTASMCNSRGNDYKYKNLSLYATVGWRF